MGKIIEAIFIKGLPAADIKNANKANLWIFLWAGTLVATFMMQEMQIIQSAAESLVASVVNLTMGLIMVVTYRRMLLALDEMERTIQYNALASAVAMTLLVYGASSILSNAALVPELDASQMLMIIALTYSGGLIVGRVRMA